MTNNLTFASTLDYFKAYMDFSASKHFIVGGIIGDVVKFAFVEPNDLVNNFTFVTGSKSGNGGNRALRFKFSKSIKEKVDNEGVTLCSKAEFEELASSLCKARANRGEAFEKLVTEYFGQVWTRSNDDFTKCGDIVINGIHYQIKTHKGLFSNERTLMNLLAE